MRSASASRSSSTAFGAAALALLFVARDDGRRRCRPSMRAQLLTDHRARRSAAPSSRPSSSPRSLAAPLEQRVAAILEVARRYARRRSAPPAARLRRRRARRSGARDGHRGAGARAAASTSSSRDRTRMVAILASMVEGVLVVDEQGRLQHVNDAARRMLRTRITTPSTTSYRRGHSASRHRRPDLTRVLAGEQSEGLELSRDARRRAARSSRAWRRSSSAGRGAVLVLHDITDLRRADQIRRDFVANVSHELRTPLTAIKGYAEALMDEPGRRRRSAAVPRDHPSPRDAHGAAGEGSAAAGAARRRTGDGGARPRATSRRSSRAWSTTSKPRRSDKQQQITRRRRARGVRASSSIRRSCTTSSAT